MPIQLLLLCRDEAEKLLESKELATDGRLSYEEFMGEQTKAEKLFKLMDKDGDGYVTKNVNDTFCQTNYLSRFIDVEFHLHNSNLAVYLV